MKPNTLAAVQQPPNATTKGTTQPDMQIIATIEFRSIFRDKVTKLINFRNDAQSISGCGEESDERNKTLLSLLEANSIFEKLLREKQV